MPTPEDTATIADLIAKVASLSAKFDGAITQILELKSQFVFFQANFTPKEVYNIKHEELVKQVATNTSDIRYLSQTQRHNVSWVWPIIAFVAGGGILFLFEYALTH